MNLTPPMADPATTTIPTAAILVATASLTPLPTTTQDATTTIPTGSCLMTTEMSSTISPLTTSSYAKQILTISWLAMKIITHPTSSTNINDNNYDHVTYQVMPENKDDDPPRQFSLLWTLSLPTCAQWKWWWQWQNRVISNYDKENSSNNDDQYGDRIPGHHRGASEIFSNSPDVVDDHSDDSSLDCHDSSNHGGSNGPSHDSTPPQHTHTHTVAT